MFIRPYRPIPAPSQPMPALCFASVVWTEGRRKTRRVDGQMEVIGLARGVFRLIFFWRLCSESENAVNRPQILVFSPHFCRLKGPRVS